MVDLPLGSPDRPPDPPDRPPPWEEEPGDVIERVIAAEQRRVDADPELRQLVRPPGDVPDG